MDNNQNNKLNNNAQPTTPIQNPSTQPVQITEPVAVPATPIISKPVETPVATIPSTSAPINQDQNVLKPINNIVNPTTPIQAKIENISEKDLYVPTSTEKNIINDNNQSKLVDGTVNIEQGNRKLPIIVLAIFIILLTTIIIYYSLIMTPEKIFDKAINSIFTSISTLARSVEESEYDTMGLNIAANMETVEDETRYLNGMLINGNFDIDLRKYNIGLDLSSQRTNTKDEGYNLKIYENNGSIYVSNNNLNKALPNKVIKLTNSTQQYTIDSNKINNTVDIINSIKEKIMNDIQNEKLDRTIAMKKVKDQTAITFKSNCKLKNLEISDIYHKIFSELYSDEEEINKISSIIGIKKEELKQIIGYLNARTVVTKTIDINLYMNLANTQLVSLDVVVDDYYVKIDNMNGYFIGNVKYKGQNLSFDNPEFNIEFEYDLQKGLLEGTGYVDKKGQTMLYSKFNYIRKETDDRKTGNELNLNFYYDKSDNEEILQSNVIAKLKCTLDIIRQKEIIIPEEKDSIPASTNEIKGEIFSSISLIKHYYDYALRKLLFNKWDDQTYVKNMIGNKMMKNNATVADLEYEQQYAKKYCSMYKMNAHMYDGTTILTDNMKTLVMSENNLNLGWYCSTEESKDIDFKQLLKK